MQAPKPKLRWYQYSLRTLFVFMVLFAIACSWLAVKMQRARKQQEAVQEIERLGGEVLYDYQQQPRGGTRYSLTVKPPGPSWLRGLLTDHFFVTAVRLRVGDQQALIDNDGLSYLRDLPNLENVSFYRVRLRECDLKHFKHLKKLTFLGFRDGTLPVSGEPSRFGFLEDCRQLQVFSARGQFDNSDLANLRRARKLRNLFLYDNPISDDGLAYLEQLTNLEYLGLGGTQVTDDGLAHLRSLGKLTYLCLNHTQVTDVGLNHLKELTSLGELELFHTRVTDQGVAKLQKALPNCKIIR